MNSSATRRSLIFSNIFKRFPQFFKSFQSFSKVFNRFRTFSIVFNRFQTFFLRFSTNFLPFCAKNIGDEGNRTLISAMRPRRAPVTLRPLNPYILIIYDSLKLPLLIAYNIFNRLSFRFSLSVRRVSKCHKFNYSNTLRYIQYFSHLFRLERPYPARRQS